jgi:UDP-N-acetylglucosamine acyltransferase
MVTIHPTAVIGPNVEIEDDVYVGPLCVIGFPAEWKGRENEDKGVLICSGARLTGLVTVDSGVERRTVIGQNCYLMKAAHVGHDAYISANVTISCGAKIGGHAFIGDGCNIGLNAVIHQRQSIGEGCMIGMGAVVTKGLQCEAWGMFAGNPAKKIGNNERHPRYTNVSIVIGGKTFHLADLWDEFFLSGITAAPEWANKTKADRHTIFQYWLKEKLGEL